MVVYKITNTINGKMYVGQTRKNVEDRFRQHINDAIAGRGHYLHRAIRKYGIDNFTIEVLAETDDENELNRLEEYYIRSLRTVECGYNLSYGGDSNTMDCPKARSRHDAVMRSEEVRAKISASIKKQIYESGRTQEYAKNLLDGLAAYRQTSKYLADKAKFRLSPEHYKALNDAKNKAVYCINTDGEIVAEFSRVKDGAYWWYENGYIVKDPYDLCNVIKKSYKEDRFIRGLKWIYRV